ncbi:hypothetical protein F2Q68_00026377 [Brassica cretica]|uniref:Uncharacterized protein n=1 Tax=Brassica cretica TaxID=69181 RepID=A0A8S9IGR9_BRACR|nr:hypothetical protein F2Q68_00026377 [Brassica cretica]
MRFEEGGSRNRNSRWVQSRGQSEEERGRSSRAQRRERSPLGKPRKEVHEEGEIRHEGSGSNSLQHEVMPKPATPSRMQQGTSQPLGDSDKEGITEELERSKEDLEEGVTNVDGEVMELGEVPENWEEADAILELVHEFQNLADGENKEVSKDDARWGYCLGVVVLAYLIVFGQFSVHGSYAWTNGYMWFLGYWFMIKTYRTAAQLSLLQLVNTGFDIDRKE